MASITLKGNPINTNGELPSTESTAPDFKLTTKDLRDVSLSEYSGKRKILNIVPSLDTGVCAASAKVFNEKASQLENTVVLVISADLPFAMGRFCEAENIENVETLSMIRGRTFAKDYGVFIEDGPLAGVAARAIVVLNEENQVLYTELVPEITQEPNYDAAIDVL